MEIIHPTDETGFLEFARNLRSPDLYHTIRDLEPLSPIRGYRGTENRRWYFETIRTWPDGLVVIGDVVCSFNRVWPGNDDRRAGSRRTEPAAT
jgi:hypothetical protein